jgi:hypothetical protein
MKRVIFILSVMLAFVFGCGQDRETLSDTKFDASLRQKIASIGEDAEAQVLSIVGNCSSVIDAPMRQELIDAGANVITMKGETFTAEISSEDVFSVAALEFVTQLKLSGGGKK